MNNLIFVKDLHANVVVSMLKLYSGDTKQQHANKRQHANS